MVVLMNPSTQPWTVPSPAEKRAGLGNGLQPFPIKKTDYYKTIDLRNSTELGRGRASWGEYDAMQWKAQGSYIADTLLVFQENLKNRNMERENQIDHYRSSHQKILLPHSTSEN